MSKTIVITGASAGIGAALARRLAGEGHRLALVARREPELDAVARDAGSAVAIVADVTRRSEVERVRDEAIAALGHVDVWVNNVGQGIARPVLELTDEDVDAMIAVNVKSALYGMQAIVPHFRSRGTGHLVNVSSFLGRVPLASPRSAYSAAKAALGSITANLRMDLARTDPGLHVTLVMPGIVLTDFGRNVRGEPTAPPPAIVASPFMRPQTADEVAVAIAGAIATPVAELYTNPAHAEVAARYVADVAGFEASWPPR